MDMSRRVASVGTGPGTPRSRKVTMVSTEDQREKDANTPLSRNENNVYDDDDDVQVTNKQYVRCDSPPVPAIRNRITGSSSFNVPEFPTEFEQLPVAPVLVSRSSSTATAPDNKLIQKKSINDPVNKHPRKQSSNSDISARNHKNSTLSIPEHSINQTKDGESSSDKNEPFIKEQLTPTSSSRSRSSSISRKSSRYTNSNSESGPIIIDLKPPSLAVSPSNDKRSKSPPVPALARRLSEGSIKDGLPELNSLSESSISKHSSSSLRRSSFTGKFSN